MSKEEIFNMHTHNEMLGLMTKSILLDAMEEYAELKATYNKIKSI